MRTYSDIHYQRLQNLVSMFVQQLFMLNSKSPFTTQWRQSGQTVKFKHVVSFRTEMVAENTLFGTQTAVWKGRLWGRPVLEENVWTVASTTSELSDCPAFDFISNIPYDKWVEQFCDYLLEKYIDTDLTFPPPVWSERSGSSFRTTNACESLHTHFNALFNSACPNISVLVSAMQKIQNEAYVKTRSVTTWRLKKSASLPKKDPISKIGQYRANLISRIEFFSSLSYKFLPNSSLSPTLTMPLVTSVSVAINAQNNIHYVCHTAVGQDIWDGTVSILKININIWY